MLLTLDVDDHIDPESRDWLTLDETGRIVRTPQHEARAAEIGVRFEAWCGENAFDAEQARWAGLIGSRVKADAMNMDAFGGWNFDEHPFATLGGYEQARRVFGGEASLHRLITGFNAAVFGRQQAAGGSQGDRGRERQ
jgi:type I restriction enzyme R subunit